MIYSTLPWNAKKYWQTQGITKDEDVLCLIASSSDDSYGVGMIEQINPEDFVGYAVGGDPKYDPEHEYEDTVVIGVKFMTIETQAGISHSIEMYMPIYDMHLIKKP